MQSIFPQITAKPAIIARKLFKLERQGRYDAALEEVSEIWKDLSEFPNVEFFTPSDAAEFLLRCGSLLGFLGNCRQIDDSQQNSRNILTEARSRFLELENSEKVAECENYLALTYWRKNELNEAKIWLAESFIHELPVSSHTRLYSHIIETILLASVGNYAQIIDYCKTVEESFRNYGDASLNANFCTNLGIAYDITDNRAEALKYLELAQFFHQKSGHKIYLATVENNLAQLYKAEGRFVKSHKSIDNAIGLFKKAKDKTREGFSLDTKAQIFFAEKKFAEALKTIDKAVAILKKSENLGYLVETLMTKSKILLYLNDFPAAILSLFEAVKITEQQHSLAAAQNLVETFETFLEERNNLPQETAAPKPTENGQFEIVLPDQLAHFTNIQGVLIHNSHLERIGLSKGSMAIVSKQDVGRGDLVAVVEKESDAVICGFYDNFFGIISLEGIDRAEPQLFDEAEMQILGKIIGVCDPEKPSDGKTYVRPIEF